MLSMHIPGSWILLIFAVLLTIVILLVLHFTELGMIIHQQIPDRPQRRMFLASVSFFLHFWRCGCWSSRSLTMSDLSVMSSWVDDTFITWFGGFCFCWLRDMPALRNMELAAIRYQFW